MTVTTTAALEARGVTLGYEGNDVFRDLDIAIEPGRITGLLGPNGCGKSTLLKAFGRILKPTAGTIAFDGEDISGISTRAVARRLALLPQKPLTPAATSVRDLVARGRHPHRHWKNRFLGHAARTDDAGHLGRRRQDLAIQAQS